MKPDITKIIEVVRPVVEGEGYELVDLAHAVRYGTDTITVVIFRHGDMSHSDCERVHVAVDGIFDDMDPFDGRPYNLEVSSMGLDWNLKTDADLNRRKGEELEITFFGKVDGAKKITGVLDDFDASALTLSLTDTATGKPLGKTQIIDRKTVAKAVIAIRF